MSDTTTWKEKSENLFKITAACILEDISEMESSGLAKEENGYIKSEAARFSERLMMAAWTCSQNANYITDKKVPKWKFNASETAVEAFPIIRSITKEYDGEPALQQIKDICSEILAERSPREIKLEALNDISKDIGAYTNAKDVLDAYVRGNLCDHPLSPRFSHMDYGEDVGVYKSIYPYLPEVEETVVDYIECALAKEMVQNPEFKHLEFAGIKDAEKEFTDKMYANISKKLESIIKMAGKGELTGHRLANALGEIYPPAKFGMSEFADYYVNCDWNPHRVISFIEENICPNLREFHPELSNIENKLPDEETLMYLALNASVEIWACPRGVNLYCGTLDYNDMFPSLKDELKDKERDNYFQENGHIPELATENAFDKNVVKFFKTQYETKKLEAFIENRGHVQPKTVDIHNISFTEVYPYAVTISEKDYAEDIAAGKSDAVAEMVARLYPLHNDKAETEIGCEPTAEGIMTYMNAVKEIYSRDSEEIISNYGSKIENRINKDLHTVQTIADKIEAAIFYNQQELNEREQNIEKDINQERDEKETGDEYGDN